VAEAKLGTFNDEKVGATAIAVALWRAVLRRGRFSFSAQKEGAGHIGRAGVEVPGLPPHSRSGTAPTKPPPKKTPTFIPACGRPLLWPKRSWGLSTTKRLGRRPSLLLFGGPCSAVAAFPSAHKRRMRGTSDGRGLRFQGCLPIRGRGPLLPKPTPNPDLHPCPWEATSVAEAKLSCRGEIGFGWRWSLLLFGGPCSAVAAFPSAHKRRMRGTSGGRGLRFQGCLPIRGRGPLLQKPTPQKNKPPRRGAPRGSRSFHSLTEDAGSHPQPRPPLLRNRHGALSLIGFM